MLNKKRDLQDIFAGIYIICYFLVNFSILEQFPFVHSDEAWLSGLTRNIAETGSIGVTETFYDLKPRYPHAVKTLFHLMQMGMMQLFGYQIGTFRLLSLVFGCLGLGLFYRFLKTILRGDFAEAKAASGIPLLGCILLSADIQFIYASHFARQEIILVFMLLLCLNLIIKKRFAAAGAVTGLSIGLHPNSFLLAAMCGMILLPSDLKKIRGREGWRPLLIYTCVVGCFAAAFTAASLLLDTQFFRHYLEYGDSEFEIGAPVWSKLGELPYFIQKLWFQVSGTYYVPDIRPELVLFAVTIAGGLSLLLSASKRVSGGIPESYAVPLLLKGIAGVVLGMVVIGRYNQTSIVFLFPLFFALFIAASERFFSAEGLWKGNPKGRGRVILLAGLILLLGSSSIAQIRPWLNHSYDAYLNEISEAVSPDRKVLANLNCEYYFENGKLLDYRNLSYLKENRLTVADYIERNQIEYIVLSDEMDLIYSQRPVWNIIYGNPRYMEELRAFTKEHCTLVHAFQDNVYGVRILPYMNRADRSFTVEIFAVEDYR